MEFRHLLVLVLLLTVGSAMVPYCETPTCNPNSHVETATEYCVCDQGWFDCDNDDEMDWGEDPLTTTTCQSTNGCESDLTDSANCGACGNQCDSGQECHNGECAVKCYVFQSIPGQCECTTDYDDCHVYCSCSPDSPVFASQCSSISCIAIPAFLDFPSSCQTPDSGSCDCGSGSDTYCLVDDCPIVTPHCNQQVKVSGGGGYTCSDSPTNPCVCAPNIETDCSEDYLSCNMEGETPVCSCPEGYANCDQLNNDCETDIFSISNCGGCGNSCDDGKSCTEDSCVDGACINNPNNANCEDAFACTTDICDTQNPGANPVTGCVNENVASGTPCDDENACTENDICSGGVCTSGTPVIEGLQGGCNPGFACCPSACQEIICGEDSDCVDEGNPCTDEVCNNPGVCTGTCSSIDVDSEERTGCDTLCCSGSCIGAYTCTLDTDCDNGDACTIDTCDSTSICGGECNSDTITQCIDNDDCCPAGCDGTNDNDCTCGDGTCSVDEDYSSCSLDCCDDLENPCAQGICCYDECTDPVCSTGTCDDQNICTDDVCLNPGECPPISVCSYTPVSDCCLTNADCQFGYSCNLANDCVIEYDCSYSQTCVFPLVCAELPDGTPKHCCESDECWSGVSCVNEYFPAGLIYYCNNGLWEECNSTTQGEQRQDKVCISEQWIDIVSLGDSCYDDLMCSEGVCCATKCARQDTLPCDQASDCCSDYCTAGHCCPDGDLWCNGECRQPLTSVQSPCACDVQCAEFGDYACSNGDCLTSGPCTGQGQCEGSLVCAKDFDDYAYCCSKNSCYEDGCIPQGDLSSSGTQICLNSTWSDYCVGSKNLDGVCDANCGAPSVCDQEQPGTDINDNACKSDCTTTTDQIQLEFEIREYSASIVDTLETAPINDTLEPGSSILVNYSIPLTTTTENNTIVLIYQNNQLLEEFNETSGMKLISDLDVGSHEIKVISKHPDLVDSSEEQTISIVASLEDQIELELTPEEITSKPRNQLNFSLGITNIGNEEHNFTISAGLSAEVDDTVSIPAVSSVTLPLSLTAPQAIGEHQLTVTLTQGSETFSISSTIKVQKFTTYSFEYQVYFDKAYILEIENTGTESETYEIEACGQSVNLTINPGEKDLIEGVEMTEICEVCIIGKTSQECFTLEPLTFTTDIPSKLEADLNQETTFTFKTQSSSDKTISVSSSNGWISDFTCNANCNKEITFVPDSLGEKNIQFEIEIDGIKAGASMKINVIQTYNAQADNNEINELTNQLEAEIVGLEQRGIDLHEVQSMVDQVRRMDLDTPEGAAQALSILQQAEQFIEYIKGTAVPKPRKLPITNVIIGVVALAAGAFALTLVFKHEDHPHHKEGLAPRKFGYKPGGRPIHSKPIGREKERFSRTPRQKQDTQRSPSKVFKGGEIPKLGGKAKKNGPEKPPM